MDGTVIVSDDDRTIRTVLSQALTRAGCRVRATSTIATLWQWVEAGEGDVIVTDVMMPDGDALDLVPAIKRKRPDLPVVVMSAQNTVMTAIRANEAGAYEYLPKPFDLREMLSVVNKALNQSSKPTLVADPSKSDIPDRGRDLPLVGGSQAMQDVYRILARLMNTDLSVLITGESGTGKELVARTLHDFGHRAAHPFVAFNIGATSAEGIERELFGRDGDEMHAPELGRIEQANSGTLFLDEVADIPIEAQKKLLRVLQDGTFRRVGGRQDIKADIRIIASTHQDLRNLINEGRFREDLFYRLNVVPIRLPSLRDRVEDIPDLARHFLVKAAEDGLPKKDFTKDALDRLRLERWPGNVRELENFVHRIVALSQSELIEVSVLEQELVRRPSSFDDPSPEDGQNLSRIVQTHLQRYFDLHGEKLPPVGLYHRILKEVELPLFALTLSATRGNQVKAAELLGINRNTLRKKVQELDISVTRGKRMM